MWSVFTFIVRSPLERCVSIWAIGCLLALMLTACGVGCAMEKAVDAASDLARTTATTLVEKAPPLTSLTAGAEGDINNPTYRVLAVVVNGVLLEIGLDGVQVSGNIGTISAGLEGGPLSPETLAVIRSEMLEGDAADELIARILDALAEDPVLPEIPQAEIPE